MSERASKQNGRTKFMNDYYCGNDTWHNGPQAAAEEEEGPMPIAMPMKGPTVMGHAQGAVDVELHPQAPVCTSLRRPRCAWPLRLQRLPSPLRTEVGLRTRVEDTPVMDEGCTCGTGPRLLLLRRALH